jgi:hypothetical protein
MSEDIFDSYHETQKELYWMEILKVRRKLLTIAILMFAIDLLNLLINDMLTFQLFLWVLLVPVIIAALAFLAMKEPMAAMILASLIILALWIYAIVLAGGIGLVSGLLVKAVIVYLLIAGFQSAREAHRLKREIGM